MTDLHDEYDRILFRLDKVKRQGDGRAMACCPAHADKTPSLSVRIDGERILLHCFAGCAVDDVCMALDVEKRRLFARDASLEARAITEERADEDAAALRELLPPDAPDDLVRALLAVSAAPTPATAVRGCRMLVSMAGWPELDPAIKIAFFNQVRRRLPLALCESLLGSWDRRGRTWIDPRGVMPATEVAPAMTGAEWVAAVDTAEAAYRAAIAEAPDVALPVEDLSPEARERRELRGRASFGAFLVAALAGREVDGGSAEAEYRSACGLSAGIPMDLFEQDRPLADRALQDAGLATRAVTPAPGSGTGVTVAPVQPFLFAPSIAPRLGIDMPSAPSGSYSEMTISTALMPVPEPKGDAADGTAAALTAVTAAPRRISSRLSLSLEDVAAVGTASFESALRQHAQMALSNAYDDQAINGAGGTTNVNGLIAQLTDPTDPTAVATFDDFVAGFADALDGLWASRMSEVAIVANVDAYKLAAKTYRGAAADGGPAITAGDYLDKATGVWWTNKRMPATASSIARGIVYRMGRPGIRTACHPTWGSLAIDDIFTDSAKGQRHFTLHTLVGDRVILVQPDAYGLVEYKVSA